MLSYVRFLYLARHRQLFRDEVLSELMPPLEPDGTSLLWEALGRKFTGLSYQEADRLSQDNKEFIRALFPQDPIYASLLPGKVQELIGQVGPRDQGGREDAARDRVQLRRPHRSVRRRPALSRAHRRDHAGARRRGRRAVVGGRARPGGRRRAGDAGRARAPARRPRVLAARVPAAPPSVQRRRRE